MYHKAETLAGTDRTTTRTPTEVPITTTVVEDLRTLALVDSPTPLVTEVVAQVAPAAQVEMARSRVQGRTPWYIHNWE